MKIRFSSETWKIGNKTWPGRTVKKIKYLKGEMEYPAKETGKKQFEEEKDTKCQKNSPFKE